MNIRNLTLCALLAGAAMAALPATAAQAPGGRPPETWWVEKTQGGVFKAPMRAIWRLADLKQMHAGQNNWSEQIIKDPEQEATYNSGAPGTRISRRMHPDTHTVYVIIAGEVAFDVEGQPPVTAVRGSIVNIQKTTVYSAEVRGSTNALWVKIDPANYVTVYPNADPKPAATKGGTVIPVTFNHTPGSYTAPNRLHYNLFEAIAACEPTGAKVWQDGIFVNPLINYANPADNKCARPPAPGAPGGGSGGGGGGGGAAAAAPFNPASVFGHLHAGPAEWWIVQTGTITARFEKSGEYVAVEGDVLYAPPMSWHQMGVRGAGPSVRTAMGGYNLINMGNAGVGD